MRRDMMLGAGAAWLATIGLAQAAPAMQFRGEGVQIYTCSAAGSAHAWTLKAPDARLLDAAGKQVGRHFAGPSWQASDGSTVVGEALVTSAAPQEGAVPWLVLRAKSHAGSGVFGAVAYVTRTDTAGGAAPAAGCDAAHANSETRVPYSALYSFFPQPG